MWGWKVLYQTTSSVSGKIEVITNGNERRLRVNDITQSSDFLDAHWIGYWSGLIPTQPVNDVLLLGLGGGTVTKILKNRWPNVKVTAYELDPEVVRVAKEFFGLGNSVEVIVADAREAFKNAKVYDLIIVDLYIGNVIADFSEQLGFLKQVYDHLRPGGLASFNKYYGNHHKKRLDEVVDRTKQIFLDVWLQQNELNMIVWAKR